MITGLTLNLIQFMTMMGLPHLGSTVFAQPAPGLSVPVANPLALSLPEFNAPERLWVLLVLPGLMVLYVVLLMRKSKRGMRFTNPGLLSSVVTYQSRWRRHLAVIMALASLASLGMAWAKPVGIEKVPRERATVVIILDVSQSMKATDVTPNRLEAEKESARKFIAELPEKFNVSIVALSGAPSTVVPPTTDRNLIERALKSLDYADGTAIGTAITAGLSAVNMAPEGDSGEPAPAAMVLLSDGQNISGDSIDEAVAKAQKREIPIHTIAFGTANGYVDIDGKRENVQPDPEALKSIADRTGGTFHQAKSADQLNSVYENLQSDVGYEDVKKEITARWCLYALGFAIVAAFGVISIAARWP